MDLESAILDAWCRLRRRLDDDPHDLARRLARRRRAVLTRPPRAWCLALRASDARLAGKDESGLPVHASSLRLHPFFSKVTLSPANLRRLCAPVTIEPPGETVQEIATKLGTTPMGLRNARINGVFRVHHLPGLAGRRGRPVPLLYTDQPLDPAARNFALADPAWTWTAHHLVTRLPASLGRFTLTRVPCFRPHVPHRRYAEHVHPEALDQPWETILKRRKRLPEPAPDYVWYKWSRGLPGTGGIGSHYLGDDPSNWRKSPQDPGDRPPRYLRKYKQKPKPKPSRSAGSLHFNGWTWLCPACGKTCRTIYLPLPPLNLLAHVQPRLAQVVEIKKCVTEWGITGCGSKTKSPHPVTPHSVTGFSCARCHRVKFFSRLQNEAWNDLIAYLTGGLLYGRELPRPAWFTKDRKRAYAPRPNARPSLRRPQVTELLLQGLTYAQIGRRLGLSERTINDYATKVYAQHRVHGRAALARKLNRSDPTPPSKPQRVRPLLAAGLTYRQIAARLGLTLKAARHHGAAIRREARAASAVASGAALEQLSEIAVTAHDADDPQRSRVRARQTTSGPTRTMSNPRANSTPPAIAAGRLSLRK